jgi:hypothetical protein
MQNSIYLTGLRKSYRKHHALMGIVQVNPGILHLSCTVSVYRNDINTYFFVFIVYKAGLKGRLFFRHYHRLAVCL